jgi:LuxR family maltose regulon positive regulatory protein
VHQNNIESRVSSYVAEAQILALLSQDLVAAAAQLAEEHNLPMEQARVHLAQGDTASALVVLAAHRQQMEAKAWHYERLKAMVLQAVVLDLYGSHDEALAVLLEVIPLAVTGGYIRLFLDEGLSMASLFMRAKEHGIMPDYVGKVITAFEAEHSTNISHQAASQPLVEPLSERELEILQLLADGLSNRDVSKRLFIALDTVKGHNRNIYQKLQVNRRTEAVARARELGLI